MTQLEPKQMPDGWRTWRVAELRRHLRERGLAMPYMQESRKREIHEWVERYVTFERDVPGGRREQA